MVRRSAVRTSARARHVTAANASRERRGSRYGVEIGGIVNQKFPTEDNKADGFTKPNELVLGDAGGGGASE